MYVGAYVWFASPLTSGPQVSGGCIPSALCCQCQPSDQLSAHFTFMVSLLMRRAHWHIVQRNSFVHQHWKARLFNYLIWFEFFFAFFELDSYATCFCSLLLLVTQQSLWMILNAQFWEKIISIWSINWSNNIILFFLLNLIILFCHSLLHKL